MNDKEVWQILIATFDQLILDWVNAEDLGQNVVAKRANQPRQEGANSQDTAYISRINSRRYGFQGRKDEYDDVNDVFVHTETYIIESVYQVSVEADDNPSDETQITSFDIAQELAGRLQTIATRLNLKNQGVNIIRITEVRTPYFLNDADRFEGEPSFDFTISYEQDIISSVPAVADLEDNIYRV